MDEIKVFLLNSFSVGAFALFWVEAVYLLLRGRHNKARRVLSYVYILFGLACLIRIVAFQLKFVPSTFPYFNITTIVAGSFIIILTFLYPIEVITPGWLNKKRTLLYFLPITLVTAFYYVVLDLLGQDIVHLDSYEELCEYIGQFNVWFRFVFIILSTVYICVLIRKVYKSEHRYNKWKNEMYADSENMDISWMCYYGVFIILIFLAWLLNIFWGNSWSIIVHIVIVIFCTCFLFYKAIFHESPYPENFFLESLNESHAVKLNKVRLEPPSDSIIDLNDKTFSSHIPEYVSKLKVWMENEKPYLYKDFKLTDVARVLPLNRSYLSRVFNEGFGRSFSEVVRSYRVDFAKVILHNRSELSLNEVARMSGFSSDTVFIRSFSKVEGMTPIEYKESIKMSKL